MVKSQYQQRDHEVVDYALYEFTGVPVKLRGPRPKLADGQYVACIGAAQTFGALCEKPWPDLIAAKGYPTLNLGVGGAGPSFFLLNPKLIELASTARIAVVQVMAARSTRNSYLETDPGRSNARRRGSLDPLVVSEAAYQAMLDATGPRVTRLLVEETRHNWIHEMELLLDAIRVPTILLWFSERAPRYAEGYSAVSHFMSKFPQMVNELMIEAIAPRASAYVQCISSRGMPHLLKNRVTGEPAMIALGNDRQLRDRNLYYPSPEMHEDAAEILLPTVSRLWTQSAPSRS